MFKDMLIENYNLTPDEAEAVISDKKAIKILNESFETGDMLLVNICEKNKKTNNGIYVELPSGRVIEMEIMK